MHEAAFVDDLSRELAKRDKSSAILEVASLCVSLMRRIDRLEARKMPTYKGVWKKDTPYGETDLVTFGGGLWYCKRATTNARPDTYHEDWQLCVKSGKDGKDASNGTNTHAGRARGVIAHPDDPDARPRA